MDKAQAKIRLAQLENRLKELDSNESLTSNIKSLQPTKSRLDWLLDKAGIALDVGAQSGQFASQKLKEGESYLSNQIGIPGLIEQSRPAKILESQIPQDRLGVGLTAALGASGPISKSAKSLYESVSPALKRGAEFALKVGPNIYPSTSKYLIENFDDVLKSPSVKSATETYRKAFGGLKHWAESVGERFKTKSPSTHLDEIIADASLKVDEAGNDLPKMGPQEALDAIQAINLKQRSVLTEIKDKTLRAQRSGELSSIKDRLYSVLENSGNKDARKAAKGLRNAYVKEDVFGLFPKNKLGDANVLRSLISARSAIGSTVGGTGIAGALSAGNPLLAIPGLAIAGQISPKIMTREIQALRAAAKFPTKQRNIISASVAGQALNNER